MEFTKGLTKRSLHTPLICQICGDVARGMNFDVITCMSCKAFFRRHALRSLKDFHCLLDNDCDITKQTRGACSACRLKKCLSTGMNPNLIRSPYQTKMKKKQIKNDHLPQPKPICLLNHDRSILTLDEWNLLSNIIHTYDEQNLVAQTRCRFKEQSSLPPKLRSNPTNTLELIGLYYTAIQPFIERSPYFCNLPKDIRRVIIQNNLNGTGGFNTMVAAAEAEVFDNEYHIAACNKIYGADYVKESHQLLMKMESNRTLLKIMLMILVFSTNCSIVTYDYSINLINISPVHSFHLMHIQNVFITMLWKYLVYQYGYVNAIRCLARLVKNYLDVLNRMHENLSGQHWQMVDQIVEQMTHSLVLDD